MALNPVHLCHIGREVKEVKVLVKELHDAACGAPVGVPRRVLVDDAFVLLAMLPLTLRLRAAFKQRRGGSRVYEGEPGSGLVGLGLV